MRYKQSEIDELLSHLQSEFGSHGRRAAEYLSTARNVLDWASGHETDSPRIGNSVAYCLREAMTAILDSQGGSRQSWRTLSREVVDAKHRYERFRPSGSDEHGLLTELLERIDRLGKFHEREANRERSLIAVLFDRTGSDPVAGSTSVKRYQRTLGSLNKVVHGAAPYGVASAERDWLECLALLAKLFLPDVRYRELERLATIEQPNAEHADEVSELVLTAAHLRYFLARIIRPTWLDVLTDSGMLDPPDNGEGWPAFVATEGLAREHPAQVSHWLNKMYSRLSGNTKYVSMIGDAALSIGDIGLPLVARIVRKHWSEPDVVRLSWDAALRANPSLDTYESIVDVVFNQQSRSFAWPLGEIAERFVGGIDSSNAMRRVQLLAHKIRSTPEDDRSRSRHEHDPCGSIGDRYDDRDQGRFDALIHALMTGILSARRFVDVASLLDLVDSLPGMIGVRMRMWLLGNSPAVRVGVLIEEIAEAIGRRQPNGDDLPLIDRVVQMVDPTQYEDRWREALGAAPDVEHVGRALAADGPREEWIRKFEWLPLLNLDPDGAWEDVAAILSARYGAFCRDLLESKSAQLEGEIIATDSPFSIDELSSLSVEDACRRISSWRPREGDWMFDAHALAKTLEGLVANSPTLWARNPIRIAMELRHPTYIFRYLVGICATLSENGAPIDKLIRLVTLLRTHPWKPDSLGRNNLGYDTSWINVDRATIDIIESLAKKDIGYAGLSNEVWRILESAVRDRSDSTERGSVPDQRDRIDIAINLPQTKALWAVLEFMAYEFRSTNHVRAEAFCLLAEVLRLEGEDGLYHRAILAANLGLLLNICPEWTERTKNLLLGADAPNGLGLKTLDQALKRGKLNRWLLEEFRCGVMDAVCRRVEKAIAHYLWAVLWDWQGYSLDEAAEFLGSQPDLLEEAGERLGYLLDSDGVKPFHIERAVQFWRRMLDKGKHVDGIAGFGGLARVTEMDDRQWSELTLETLGRTGGRINQAYEVAQRAAGMTPGVTTLEIVDNLVRRSNRVDSNGDRDRIYFHTRWAQRQVENAARELLDRSTGLKDTDHYRRLYTTLRERGIEVNHPREPVKPKTSESPRSAAINGTSSARPKNRTSTPS